MGHADTLFEPWTNFYVIVGSAAAALTGLMFVVITLITSEVREQPRSTEATACFSTPTVVHFGAALFVAALLAAPWHGLVYPRVLLFAASLWGLAYVSHISIRIHRMPTYRADLEDRLWHTVFPAVAYAAILIGSIVLGRCPAQAPYGFATASLLMLFTGIHNAWDIVTYVALGPGSAASPDTANAPGD